MRSVYIVDFSNGYHEPEIKLLISIKPQIAIYILETPSGIQWDSECSDWIHYMI